MEIQPEIIPVDNEQEARKLTDEIALLLKEQEARKLTDEIALLLKDNFMKQPAECERVFEKIEQNESRLRELGFQIQSKITLGHDTAVCINLKRDNKIVYQCRR